MKVKICGITHPEDAEYAAHAGADYIGIVFAPSSKRHVSLSEAKAIADAAKKGGAEPVGIFVDETADQILAFCQATGIKTVQLHGTTSKQALSILQEHYSIIYAIPVEVNGTTSKQHLPYPATFLFDCLKGGTGQTFNWNAFSPPKDTKWILAGGLNPENVSTAIGLLHPYGVDVASGVEFPFSTRKDPLLMKTFIQTAKQAKRAS